MFLSPLLATLSPLAPSPLSYSSSLLVVILDRLTRTLAPLHPRLRVEGLTDEQSRSLPVQLDTRAIIATELLTLETDAAPLDLIRIIPGVGDYTYVRAAAIPVDFFDMQIDTLDLPQLIESKRAVRRPKDLAALPHIEAVLRMREADAARAKD